MASTVTHRVHPVTDKRKGDLLTHVLKESPGAQALVFCRTKHGSNRVGQYLERAGINAAVIHGNKSQGARTKALGDFKAGRVTVLVATDIAARGLDIAQLPLVVNFDLPLVPRITSIAPAAPVARASRVERCRWCRMRIEICCGAFSDCCRRRSSTSRSGLCARPLDRRMRCRKPVAVTRAAAVAGVLAAIVQAGGAASGRIEPSSVVAPPLVRARVISGPGACAVLRPRVMLDHEHHSWIARDYGLMFWLTRNRLSGSYFRLIAASRS